MNIREGPCLYHGDCLELLPGLPEESVDAIVTDPPFKLSQEYTACADPDNLIAVASLWPAAPLMLRAAKPGALCALFYDTRILPLALRAMNDGGWKYLRALTFYRRWGQASLVHGWMSTSDFLLLFVKPGGPFKFHAPPLHDVYVKAAPERDGTGHPAQKPLEFVRHLVANLAPPAGLVLDPYMGTGTTGVACRAEGREFVGMETEARYFHTAQERISGTRREPVTEQLGFAVELAL